MRKGTKIVLIVVVVLVLLTPIGYIILFCPEKSFWDGLFSGFLSTAVALIAGIPIALWIDRIIKGREDKANRKVAREKELELLELIKEELTFTNSLHAQMHIPLDSGH
jgi:hypothetical protein